VNQGNSSARYYGYSLPKQWWKPKKFALLQEELPEYLFAILKVWHELLVHIDDALKRSPLWIFEQIQTLRNAFICKAGRFTRPTSKPTLTLNANPLVEQYMRNYLAA